jgi:hypothetical protein
MTQPTLFNMQPTGLTPAAEAKLRSRTADPESSKEAAREITASGAAKRQTEHCVDLVFTHPGKTSKELAACTEELTYHQIARRLPEAQRTGKITRVDAPGGLRWWPAED